MIQRLAIIVLGLMALPAGVTLGNTLSQASIQDVSVGFDGTYKVGHWTPVRLTLAAAADRPLRGILQITVPDGDAIASDYLFPVPEIPAGQQRLIWSYVKFGRAGSPLRIQLREDDGPNVNMAFSGAAAAIPSDRIFVLELGDGLELPEAIKLRRSRNAVVHRSVTSADRLPDHLLGYAGVDVVFVVSSRRAFLDQLTDLQRRAIEGWVELGGNLVVIAATSEESVANVPFSNVLPGKVGRIAVQRQTTGIEQFASATTRIDRGSSNTITFEVPMAILQDIDGVVEVAEGFGTDQRPAVVKGIVGFGQSFFVAFDLARDPFVSWSDRRRFIAALLDLVLSSDEADGRQMGLDRSASTSLGFTDIIGQLRVALDQFQDVKLVPFSVTSTLIALYILLVGPIDYWLLKRWGKSSWTWFTFLGTIGLFLILAFLLTSHWKGDQIRTNQATIVDVDLQRSLVRGTTWMHLFSPRTERLSLDMRIESSIVEPDRIDRVLSWQGIPGAGFGGMDSGMPSTTFSQPYEIDVQASEGQHAHVSINQFPIAVWSSRSLLGQWWGACRLQDSSQLEVIAEAQLQGTVVNPLPFEIRDAYLMHDRWAYPLGNVSPGESVRLADRSAVDMQTHLTRRRVVDGRNVMTPWDNTDTDVNRILELMMFYGAAKGRNYTNLTHQYHRSVDFTQPLKSGRAVLIGRSQQVAAEVTFNGEVPPVETRAHWTYYRLQLPVKAER